MKLHPTISSKHTTRLFFKKYKYKIVIVSKGSSWFRGNDLENVRNQLATGSSKINFNIELTEADKNFILKLYTVLKKCSDYDIRVEYPLISFYSNSAGDVEKLAKLDPTKIKYVSFPEQGSEDKLDDQKILVKKLNYGYRITMGRTRQDFTNFVKWCEDKTEKVKLPKRASKDLCKPHSWGGYYFYVRDDKTLTMVKMFLGGHIQLVEAVTKV
jgi:hypothetical protein